MKKIFIQRDYSHGTGVRFSTDFPRELTGKVSTASTTAAVAVVIHTIVNPLGDLSSWKHVLPSVNIGLSMWVCLVVGHRCGWLIVGKGYLFRLVQQHLST